MTDKRANESESYLELKTYWTIQHIDAWEQAKKKGILIGDSVWASTSYEKAYKWMINQMVKRLSYQNCYPVWLWTERPDLRHRWYAEKGTTFVLLQVETNESSVLVSEYYNWHCVLNNSPLQLYEDEPIAKEESWERIFDINLLENSPNLVFTDGLHHTKLQGVTPAISINRIKVLKTFTIKH